VHFFENFILKRGDKNNAKIIKCSREIEIKLNLFLNGRQFSFTKTIKTWQEIMIIGKNHFVEPVIFSF